MAASNEVCTICMQGPGYGCIDQLEAKICMMLRCHETRRARELQSEDYISARNAIVRHIIKFQDGESTDTGDDVWSLSVFFPQGLWLIVEASGSECIATLRWDREGIDSTTGFAEDSAKFIAELKAEREREKNTQTERERGKKTNKAGKRTSRLE